MSTGRRIYYTNPTMLPSGDAWRCAVCKNVYDTEAEARSCAEADHARKGKMTIKPFSVERADGRGYCEAISRKQYEAGSWGAAHMSCAKLGVEQVDGHWVCTIHKDPKKRYGWN